MRRTALLRWLAAGLALPGVAVAQNPLPAPPQEPHHPVSPPGAAQPPPEQIAPRGGARPGTSGNTTLSDRLSRQQGMLHPPIIDPGIQAPLPQRPGGTMLVIPPPGSPGGNQQVVPK